MSYEVYFPECIETRLDGLEETARHIGPHVFRAGWLACLEAVRASFGLQPTPLITHAEEVIYDERQIDGGAGQHRISE